MPNILLRASSIEYHGVSWKRYVRLRWREAYLEELASVMVQIGANLSTFEIEKGKVYEDISIDLYNLNRIRSI